MRNRKIQIFPPTLHIPSRSAYHLCRLPFIFNVFLATAPSGNEVFLFTFCTIFLLTFLSDWQCMNLPTRPSFFFSFHQNHLNQELFQPQWTEPNSKPQQPPHTALWGACLLLFLIFFYFPGEHLARSFEYKTYNWSSIQVPKNFKTNEKQKDIFCRGLEWGITPFR